MLRISPVRTAAPVSEEQVPEPGILRQVAGYVADAVRSRLRMRAAGGGNGQGAECARPVARVIAGGARWRR
ncbi:hypothetical protein [Kitasatospora sp. NPDC050543]|uniref:hypothetical protein n=1 Tax=Kitasatospora sp. NPDC050543 TaxID=3364054 RepID=UPI0037BA4859